MEHEVDVSDRRLANIIRKLQDLPGQEIFQYLDENGRSAECHFAGCERLSARNHRRRISPRKIFGPGRGRCCGDGLERAGSVSRTRRRRRKTLKMRSAAVAKILGNTPAVCRKCYVHPAVLETYLDGDDDRRSSSRRPRKRSRKKLGDLRSEEAAVMSFLQARLQKKS